MRVSAIIRICLWAVVAVILCAVLVFGIVSNSFHIFGDFNWRGYHYDDESSYQVATDSAFELEASLVREIKIDWIGGHIRIEPYDGDTISVKETAVAAYDDQMRWRVEEGKLTIRYCTSDWKHWYKNEKLTKDLTILVPRADKKRPEFSSLEIDCVSADIDLRDLVLGDTEIDFVSGNVNISGVSFSQLDITGVSGRLDCDDVHMDFLDCETVSGGISISGSVKVIDVDSVSGEVTIVDVIAPSKVNFDSVSGSLSLSIPATPDENGKEAGFSVDLDTASGFVSVQGFDYSGGKNGICGNGLARYDLNTVSGNIYIQKIVEETN